MSSESCRRAGGGIDVPRRRVTSCVCFFRFFFGLPGASGRKTALTVFSGTSRTPPPISQVGRAKDRECNDVPERSLISSAQTRHAQRCNGPCPRHLPRSKSRALPIKVIQEHGFRELALPASIKDADRDPVPLSWPPS